jgi:hypothetical protein
MPRTPLSVARVTPSYTRMTQSHAGKTPDTWGHGFGVCTATQKWGRDQMPPKTEGLTPSGLTPDGSS